MIYCFARAQPKPRKREEEENTTTNARHQAQPAGSIRAGRQACRKAAFYPATVCVPSKLAFDRLDFINHSSGRWMSKIIICSKVPR